MKFDTRPVSGADLEHLARTAYASSAEAIAGPSIHCAELTAQSAQDNDRHPEALARHLLAARASKGDGPHIAAWSGPIILRGSLG
jgi:hypothetical protein